MFYRCVGGLATREGGRPRELEAGSVWYLSRVSHVAGGYEVAVLDRVSRGRLTGDVARVRLERLGAPLFEPVPLADAAGGQTPQGRQT